MENIKLEIEKLRTEFPNITFEEHVHTHELYEGLGRCIKGVCGPVTFYARVVDKPLPTRITLEIDAGEESCPYRSTESSSKSICDALNHVIDRIPRLVEHMRKEADCYEAAVKALNGRKYL